MELSRLSAPVLVRLQQAMEEIKIRQCRMRSGHSHDGNSNGCRIRAVENDPAIAIKPLRLITPDGTVEGEISLRAEDSAWRSCPNMRALAGKLVADLSLRMPEKLFRVTMLIQQTRLQVERKISTMIEQGAEAPALEPDSCSNWLSARWTSS